MLLDFLKFFKKTKVPTFQKFKKARGHLKKAKNTPYLLVISVYKLFLPDKGDINS